MFYVFSIFFLGSGPAWHIHGKKRKWFGTSDSNGEGRLTETPTIIKFLPVSVSFPPNFSLECLKILNTRVSGTSGHLILRPDRQLPFLSLLISLSKLISFELSFNSDILQRSETPFCKTLKYLTIFNCDEYLFRVQFQNFFNDLFSCLYLHPLKPLQSLPHLHLISTIFQSLPHLHLISTIRPLSHINFYNFLLCFLVSKLHHLLNGNGEKENRYSKDRIEGPFDSDFQQTESWIVQESP